MLNASDWARGSPKSKASKNSGISFCKINKNKQHHIKVLLSFEWSHTSVSSTKIFIGPRFHSGRSERLTVNTYKINMHKIANTKT